MTTESYSFYRNKRYKNMFQLKLYIHNMLPNKQKAAKQCRIFKRERERERQVYKQLLPCKLLKNYRKICKENTQMHIITQLCKQKYWKIFRSAKEKEILTERRGIKSETAETCIRREQCNNKMQPFIVYLSLIF